MLKATKDFSKEEALEVQKLVEKLMQDGIVVYFAKKKQGQNFIQIECPANVFDTLELPSGFTDFPYPVLFYKGRDGRMEKVASISANSVKKIILEMDLLTGKSAVSVE